jgi:hypothetical protein
VQLRCVAWRVDVESERNGRVSYRNPDRDIGNNGTDLRMRPRCSARCVLRQVDGETQSAIQTLDALCKVVSSSSASFEDQSTQSGVALSDIGYCVCKRSEVSAAQELRSGGDHFGAVTEFALKDGRASSSTRDVRCRMRTH